MKHTRREYESVNAPRTFMKPISRQVSDTKCCNNATTTTTIGITISARINDDKWRTKVSAKRE